MVYSDHSGNFAEPISLSILGIVGIVLLAYVAIIWMKHGPELARFVSSMMEKARNDYQEGQWTVYALEDHNGVQYIGRTKNVTARETWHRNTRFGLEFKVLHKNLTYVEARGLEQMYMDCYKTVTGKFPNSKIRGISLRNPNLDGYVVAGAIYLYDRIENEILGFLGG